MEAWLTVGLGSLGESVSICNPRRSLQFTRASKEEDSSKHHTIVPNGYNLGRNWLVDRAVKGGRWKRYWWKAAVEWRTDLLHEGNEG